MEKPVCLITGATDGVGKATAFALASKGFTVVLAARSAAKAEAVRREIAEASGAQDIDIVTGDLGSLSQVRRMAQTFLERHARLDVLINNAGVMAPHRRLTEDGYETDFQVNYLSHVLLTLLLMDALKADGGGRIVNLASSVYAIGRFDPQNLQGERRFSSIGAYAASKLLVLMFTAELAERTHGTGVTVNAVHPGVVDTQMLRGASGLFKVIALLARPVAVSPEVGAATSVRLATAPDLAALSGSYFAGGRPAAVRSKFDTADNRRRLWSLSLALSGLAASEDIRTDPSLVGAR